MKTYVIKYNNSYCRFGSYGKITLTDIITKASLYSTSVLGNKRIKSRKYYWIDNMYLVNSKLELIEVTIKILKETKL